MKFKIHYNGRYEDSLVVEANGETIEEIREQILTETDSRGWDREDCWAEEMKGERWIG